MGDRGAYRVGAQNGVVAGQAACLYWLMRPSQRVVRASRRGNGSSVVLLSGVVCRDGRWFCGRLEVRARGLCECLHDRRVPGFEVVDHAVAYVVADHAAQNGVVFDVAEVAEAGDEGVH